MKAYFEKIKPGYPGSINFYTAYEGFLQMGFEIIFIEAAKDIILPADEYVAVGSIQFMHQIWFGGHRQTYFF